MARITVQDCSQHVNHKFELIVLAILRTKDITSGAPITVSKDNDKEHVIALREIASGKIKVEDLREDLVSRFQTQSYVNNKKISESSQPDTSSIDSSLDFTEHISENQIEFTEEDVNNIEEDDSTIRNSDYYGQP